MSPRTLTTFALGMGAALIGGWVLLPHALYQRIEQPMQFSHKTHTGDAVGLTCEDCHSLSEDGRFSGIPTLATCEPCHTELMGDSADEKTLVEEYVAKGREIPWLVYARQPANAWFPHAPHVARAKLACEECHGAHGSSETLRPFERNRLSTYSRDVEPAVFLASRRGGGRPMKMNDCSHCHEERGVRESCLTCHK